MEVATYDIDAAVEATHWWFRARRPLVADVLRSLAVPQQALIVDLGTGTGTNLRVLRELSYTNVVGLDASPQALDWCFRKGLGPVRLGDLTALPFPDASVDVVLATDVLDHIDNDQHALAEVARVLAPGGQAIVTVPVFPSLWGLQDDVAHHRRWYHRAALLTRVAGAGLTCVECVYVNYLFYVPMWVMRRLMRAFGMRVAGAHQLNTPWLNRCLTAIFMLDVRSARWLKPPFGASLLLVVRKSSAPRRLSQAPSGFSQMLNTSRVVRSLRQAWRGPDRVSWWVGFVLSALATELTLRGFLHQMTRLGFQGRLGVLVAVLGGWIVWVWRSRRIQPAAASTPVIVRVIARLNVGGPAKQVLRLTEAMNQRGFREVLVYGRVGDGEGDLTPQATPLPLRQVPSLQRAIHPLRDVRAWWRIVQILRRERPQIVHTHTAKAGTLGRTAVWVYNLFCRRGAPRCRIVHTFHGHVLDGYFRPWQTWVFLQIERLLAHGTDRLVVVSQALKRDLLLRGIGRPEQIAVIPVGVEFGGYPPVGETAKAPRMPGQPFRIGLVGRLAAIKNPQFFLEGVSRLMRRYPEQPIQGVIIGDGELRPKILQWIIDQGLQDRIEWQGWRHDLPAVYRGLDLVCCTSQNEGTPTALIEAMAAGTPVVSADVGGVRELMGAEAVPPLREGTVERAPAGCLFRVNDAEGFVRALEQLLRDEAGRSACAAAWRAQILSRFAMSRLIIDYERLYRQLLAASA